MRRDHTPYAEMARGGAVNLAGGVDVSLPVAGYYRMKLRSNGLIVGVRLWNGPPADPVTGELLDRSWRWQAHVNGETEDFDRVWPACADEPISREDYEFYAKRQKWAQQNAPETAFANPRKKHDPLTAMLPF